MLVQRWGDSPSFRAIHSVGFHLIRLRGSANLGSGASTSALEFPEHGNLLLVIDISDLLDNLSSSVDLTHGHCRDGRVGATLPLGDTVLLFALHCHGESPSEVLF